MKTTLLLAVAFGTLATTAIAAQPGGERPAAATTSSGCEQPLLLPAVQTLREPIAPRSTGHVKVFDGRGVTEVVSENDPAADLQKAKMHIRKTGGDATETAPPTVDVGNAGTKSQNNLKQIALANTCK